MKRGGRPVSRMSDLRDMFTKKSLDLTVIRNTVEIKVDVPTISISDWQCNHVVWFLGAQFESPYYPVPLLARTLASDVYVTVVDDGSPADMYGLPCHHFVTSVNGVTTKDLESFAREVQKLEKDRYCQLGLVSLQGEPTSIPLKPNGFFKSFEIQRTESMSDWQYQEL